MLCLNERLWCGRCLVSCVLGFDGGKGICRDLDRVCAAGDIQGGVTLAAGDVCSVSVWGLGPGYYWGQNINIARFDGSYFPKQGDVGVRRFFFF